MQKNKKELKRKTKHSEESNEDEDGIQYTKSMNDEIINVDFDFYDSNPNQYFSVKNLINGLLDGQSYASSDLANLICNQEQVGTMIGIFDEEEEEKMNNRPAEFQQRDILGFSTFLPLQKLQNEAVIQSLLKYVIEKSEKFNSNHGEFQQILKNKKIGLLLNERMLNLSPKLVPILHNQVQEDLAWLEKEDNMDYQTFVFDYVLILSKCSKSQKIITKKTEKTQLESFMYQKFEDFQFLTVSENNFFFEAKSGKNQSGITNVEKETKGEINMNIINLLSWKKFVDSVKILDSYIDQ